MPPSRRSTLSFNSGHSLLGGVMALRDNRFLDSVIPGKSHGYGLFFESNSIPRRRLGPVARFDQVRATTLEQNNTVRGETAAVIYDFGKYPHNVGVSTPRALVADEPLWNRMAVEFFEAGCNQQ